MNESFICIRKAVGKLPSYFHKKIQILTRIRNDQNVPTLVCKFNAIGFYFADLIRQEKNGCNCSLPCDTTYFQPGLSYAMLSEFNIDQVALTTPAKKRAVRAKFEQAMETQQRVVQGTKKSDEAMMNRLLTIKSDIIIALNAIYNSYANTTAVSELYKIPDVLTEDESYPEQDVEYTKQYTNLLSQKEKSIEIDFSKVRENLNNIVENLMWYEDGWSIIDQIDECIDNGYRGTGDPDQRCRPPSGCDTATRYACFIRNYPLFVNGYVFRDTHFDAVERAAQNQLSKLQVYNEAINFTFAHETLDPTKYADHFECQGHLETYQNVVLPDYVDFIHDIYELTNISELNDLNDSRDWFVYYEQVLDTKLGPYLLENNNETRWGLPEIEPSERKDYDSNRLKCSWYSDIYDDEIKPLDNYLKKTDVAKKHNNLRNDFSKMFDQLEKMLEHYNEELNEPISAVKTYMDENMRKKELAELFSDQDVIRAMAKLNNINTDLKKAVKNFETSYRSFSEVLTAFYRQISEKKFPYITSLTKEHYPFLQQMMTWYRDTGGKDLIEQHLQTHGELGGSQLNINTTFTENNIWLALENAIMGFEEGDETQTGLDALVSAITNEITIPVKNLVNQMDNIVLSMTEYKSKITMNTNFYM